MYIAKGPFQFKHQQRALSQMVQARIFQHTSTHNVEQFYVALLNLEQYMERLDTSVQASTIKTYRAS